MGQPGASLGARTLAVRVDLRLDRSHHGCQEVLCQGLAYRDLRLGKRDLQQDLLRSILPVRGIRLRPSSLCLVWSLNR